ncbi:hypothetical protein HanRHA438_Chr05g0222951 [Helianthus annuus]|nr:hypothetical protein HanRHA438_Chr05g0222951 [Helianthus annuus]
MKENNFLMNIDHSEYDEKCQILVEFLMRFPISQTMTKTKEVLEKILQQFVTTFNETGVDQVSAHLWGNISVIITPARIREWLELPVLNVYVKSPKKEDLINLFLDLGYKRRTTKIGELKRNELPAFLQVMMETLNKCLTSKIGAADQINQSVLTIMYGLITGYNIDYGTEIFNLMKRSILTRTGRISSYLPYPRFLSIFAAETFEERDVELSALETISRSPTMKPWCETQWWTSNTDVPNLPESMLCLLAANSPYRRLHEEILTRPKVHEVFVINSSSSPDEEDQRSNSPEIDIDEAEGDQHLQSRNSPEAVEANVGGHQNPEAEIHHVAESHVVGKSSPENTSLLHNRFQF